MRPAVHMPEVAIITAGPLHAVDGHRLGHRADDPQRRELQQPAVGGHFAGLGVETFAMPAEDVVHVGRHRTIENTGISGIRPAWSRRPR